MTIPFANIPNGLRTPLFFAEVSASQANTAQYNQRALIIGQVTSSGSATPGVPVISSGLGSGAVLGGPGSHLDIMTQAYRANDPAGELWYLPLADAGGATSASGSLALTGTATAAGVVSLYVAASAYNPVVSVAVTSGQTAAQVASAIVAAVNARIDLPVTAAAVSGTVTFTAKNAGLVGNDIDIRLNYLGSAAGEALPAGLAATVTAMSGGATNPTLTSALANLTNQAFDFIICPYTDTASLAALAALLNDSTGRWSWTTQLYGHAFCAYRGSFSAQSTFGVTLNNQHLSVLGFNDSPSCEAAWAAAYAGAYAVACRADPAQPVQTVPINGVFAPPIPSQFTSAQRNTLLYDGISTFTVVRGQIALENLITTYQLNGSGQPDNSYLEIETLFTLTAVLRALNIAVTSNFARTKLAADGTRFAPGSNIVTPSIIRGFIIAQYRQLEYQGLVQGSAVFAANLVVQQNATNPNRVDVLWPGVLINQLRIFALLAQFRLSVGQGASTLQSASLV